MRRSTLLGVVLVLAACRNGGKEHAGDEQARGRSATPDAGPGAVTIDPSVLAAGRVATTPVTRRPLQGDVRVAAEVVPAESAAAEVGALVSGRIATFEVRDGEVVKRGQVLALVDSPEAARAVADRIRTRARAASATRRLERQVLLERDRATSPAAVDEARTDLAVAEADAAAARMLLTSLGIPEPPASDTAALPARVPVKSPIDGTLVERLVPLGAPVTPDKTLFRVVASDQVVVEARWTEESMSAPAPGFALALLPRGGGAASPCPAHVLSVIGMVDEKTRARRVRIAPDGKCPMLVPGSFVDVSLSQGALGGAAPAVLAVPREAVVDLRGASTVFVAHGAKGSFVARAVRTGRSTATDVAIEEGIAEGDLAVTTGAVLLKGELLRAELEER
ncbi:MAG: putative Co/Zn/Cd efflux system rane fusion protein [Labilithrix sp.]|nr:putative Co/Zn/Cd efflux system rane fusion protein [Labilithrix sp.]